LRSASQTAIHTANAQISTRGVQAGVAWEQQTATGIFIQWQKPALIAQALTAGAMIMKPAGALLLNAAQGAQPQGALSPPPQQPSHQPLPQSHQPPPQPAPALQESAVRAALICLQAPSLLTLMMNIYAQVKTHPQQQIM
jgi:hypothetical protein